ncbi:MAG: polysulfide reductase NrfD, partial [Gammaproteobacteria bacterium]|nr:polysulfide reductase NrfD [Gammaproteobacteria bacterium]
GTWLLTFFLGVSVLYAYTFLSRDARADDAQSGLRRAVAWVSVPLGVGVAIYTGVLLGAMPARPFWNSPVLAMLFLLSSISTGVAAILLARALLHRKDPDEKREHEYHESGYLLTTSDTLLIGLELVTLFLFLMYAHLTIGSVKEAVSVVLSGGALAGMFWFWVVLVGLVAPALIELYLIMPRLLHHKEYEVHRSLEIILPAAVLVGGFMLRYVVVIAGQITHPIGL